MSNSGLIVCFDEGAKLCPHCHYSIEPQNLFFTNIGNVGSLGALLDVAMRCVRQECLRMFISTYRVSSPHGKLYTFQHSKPHNFKAPYVTEQVIGLSPLFVEIYSQASAAEASDLDQISGVGYRKALEFLIKDYCIHKNPEKEFNIKELALSKVIGDYVDDINIKECAKRAVWLGNDETHYVRKFESQDIEDLKVLITVTMGWITNCILTSHYLENMESRKKTPV